MNNSGVNLEKSYVLATKLKVLREQLGYTQQDFCDKVNSFMSPENPIVSKQTVSNWERGVRPVPQRYHKAISSVYGLSLDTLYTRDTNPFTGNNAVENLQQVLDIRLQSITLNNLNTYDGKPVYIVFTNLKYKNQWGIYEKQRKRFICQQSIFPLSEIAPLNCRFFSYEPQYLGPAFNMGNTLSLTTALRYNTVYILVNSEDEIVKRQYNGWYRLNENKTAFINGIGLILPLEGYGLSYAAYSTWGTSTVSE